MPFVTNVYNKAKDLAPKVKDKAVRISSSLSEFISGALPAYSKYDLGDVCSSSNSGFWYMTPTDCELFSAMSSIDANNPQAKFTSAKDKLKTCVSKTGLLGVPTPFWDLKFAGWCLPSPVVTGLEYFMGALVWEGSAFDGTRAAIPSVQTLRTAVSEIKSLVADFASDSGIGLMELGRDVLRAREGREEGREEDVSSRSGPAAPNTNWGLGWTLAIETDLAARHSGYQLCSNFGHPLPAASGGQQQQPVLPESRPAILANLKVPQLRQEVPLQPLQHRSISTRPTQPSQTDSLSKRLWTSRRRWSSLESSGFPWPQACPSPLASIPAQLCPVSSASRFRWRLAMI
ncbi:unnamed protein product [Effrenium voratum]|uniref:Uncharacterized protein n=1 Tax=Effrenium voratum TaxID=2562239 RepID=A0AA36IYK3_9DINO|nr:unnamed protein product [Effrenium voratum]